MAMNKPENQAFDPNPPAPVALEIETFVRLAKAAGVNETCPMCRNEDWFLLAAGARLSTITQAGHMGHDAFTLACTQCGFVRQHVKQILAGTAEP